jgi:hypothetical protein
VALVWEVGDFADANSYQDYVIDHGTLPLGHVAMLGDAAQTLSYGLLIFPLIILCFPDGRLGRRWRWPLRAYLVICLLEVTVTVKVAVDDFRLRQPFDSSGNPVGLGPWSRSSGMSRHVRGRCRADDRFGSVLLGCRRSSLDVGRDGAVQSASPSGAADRRPPVQPLAL